MLRYLALTKPRIIVLLTITGIVGYLIPSLEDVDLLDLLIFVIIGYASAGGGMSINNVIDKDMDELMNRTRNRPSVGVDAIPENRILTFGIGISIFGVGVGLLYFGPFTALFLAWGILFYLFGYSMYLKRKSIWNTIIGGFASPSPVWAGYAARSEILGIEPTNGFLGVALEGWLLGGIVFFWSASHTFAMAGKNVEDYQKAQIPMLPVVVGMEKAGFYTFLWGLGVIAYGTIVSLYLTQNYLIVLALFIPHIALFYGLWVFYRKATPDAANICFKMHNAWLTLVFGTIVLFMWT